MKIQDVITQDRYWFAPRHPDLKFIDENADLSEKSRKRLRLTELELDFIVENVLLESIPLIFPCKIRFPDEMGGHIVEISPNDSEAKKAKEIKELLRELLPYNIDDESENIEQDSVGKWFRTEIRNGNVSLN